MASKPTVVIVPGALLQPAAYATFTELLKQAGFGVGYVNKPSTGGTKLPLTGLAEDIAAAREVIQPLVDAGKEVVVLTHSAGGVSGSGATKCLGVKARKEAGLPGGVIRVVFMAAFAIKKGGCVLEMLGGVTPPWMLHEVRLRHLVPWLARPFSPSFRASLWMMGVLGLLLCYCEADR